MSWLSKLKFKKLVSVHGVEKLTGLSIGDLLTELVERLPEVSDPLLGVALQAIEQELKQRLAKKP